MAAAELLQDVKTYLQITWSDEQTDARLAAMIDGSVAYLDDKLGAAGDYTVPGYPRDLLFERVRYYRDGALDVFENNYGAMILAMQTGRQVESYVAAQSAEQAVS